MSSNTTVSRLDDNLEGKLLISMPTIAEGCFARSVVYICAHSKDGAMGLIVNQAAENIAFDELLEQLDIEDSEGCLTDTENLQEHTIHFGGPVETSRGFVLHSPDYFQAASTVQISDGFSLTSTPDVLKAMLTGDGPEHSIIALGYAGWSPGQLENEIKHNGWLHCDADPALVFAMDLEAKYDNALSTLGIASSQLIAEAGHA
ncbi:MAG: YqgE/AlgH family protein [Pseudomonadota bacterium]